MNKLFAEGSKNVVESEKAIEEEGKRKIKYGINDSQLLLRLIPIERELLFTH